MGLEPNNPVDGWAPALAVGFVDGAVVPAAGAPNNEVPGGLVGLADEPPNREPAGLVPATLPVPNPDAGGLFAAVAYVPKPPNADVAGAAVVLAVVDVAAAWPNP